MPEENYWYRRHLAVYEWIAGAGRRAAGRRPRLRRGLRLRPARRHGGRGGRGRRQPGGPRARAAALPAPEPALRARPRRAVRGARATRSSSCRRSSTSTTRARCCERLRRRGAGRLRLDAEPADARAARAPRSPTTPGTCASTPPPSTASCSSPTSPGSRSSASSTPASCALHELAIGARLGPRPHGAADHQALLRPLRPGDRRLGLRARASATATSTARSTSSPSVTPDVTAARAGSRSAIAGHRPALATCPTSRASGPTRSARSGCSTPSIRSYLPVLEVADRLTMTVTPVLADQLEAEGVAERLLDVRSREFRLGRSPSRRSTTSSRRCRAACARRGRALPRRARRARAPRRPALLTLFAGPAGEGRIELIGLGGDPRGPAAAGDHRRPPAPGRRRPALAPPPLRRAARLLAARVRLRARPRATARRARRRATSASTRAPHEPPLDALAPSGGRLGPVAFTIDWEAISWLWSLDGYPSDPSHTDFHRKSLRGARLWSIGGEPYDPEAAVARAREQAREFAAALAARLARFAQRARAARAGRVRDRHRAARALVVRRGPPGSAEVIAVAPAAGIELRAPGRGARAPPAAERRLRGSTWGEGKDLRTWDSPAGRRPRLGRAPARAAAAARRSAAGLDRPRPSSALRASCSRSRRATGRSSTAAARRATTPSSVPPTTPRRCSRP